MSATIAEVTPTNDLGTHSKRAANAAVERVIGDKASPELKKAAAEAIAPWAERLVYWLDDFIKVPGTKWGIGLDPIIGFIVPGAGDAITGTGSIALLFLALKERVPTIVILRMCLNILVDTVGGVLPFVGDAFDVVWRSNKRNLGLIQKYKGDPEAKPTWVDYGLVGLGVVLAVLSIVVPIFVIYGLGLGAVLGLGELFSN